MPTTETATDFTEKFFRQFHSEHPIHRALARGHLREVENLLTESLKALEVRRQRATEGALRKKRRPGKRLKRAADLQDRIRN